MLYSYFSTHLFFTEFPLPSTVQRRARGRKEGGTVWAAVSTRLDFRVVTSQLH